MGRTSSAPLTRNASARPCSVAPLVAGRAMPEAKGSIRRSVSHAVAVATAFGTAVSSCAGGCPGARGRGSRCRHEKAPWSRPSPTPTVGGRNRPGETQSAMTGRMSAPNLVSAVGAYDAPARRPRIHSQRVRDGRGGGPSRPDSHCPPHLRDDCDYWVTTPDRKTYKVTKVVGADPRSDLAVMAIEATDLRAHPIGRRHPSCGRGRSSLRWATPMQLPRWPGQRQLGNRVEYCTQRRSDARPRWTTQQAGHAPVWTLIQTDAKLNLGTSGGALVNFRAKWWA